MTGDGRRVAGLGPWNPGLTSRMPAAVRPLSTIYRPDNVATTIEQADERSQFVGMDPEDLVVFRPERLVTHELLIRITGDVSVPDGNRYADLGINFRQIVDHILTAYIAPEMPAIVRAFDDLRTVLRSEAETELRATLFARATGTAGRTGGGLLGRWFGRSATSPRSPAPVDQRERQVVEQWRKESLSGPDPQRRRLCRALANVVGSIRIRHGSVRGDVETLADLATDLALNDHGSAVIGRMIEPIVRKAAEKEGYRLLPAQAEPVVMNVKGASAAGKSTLRPLQRKLAERLGIDWADFALISPDIWRKYLLDYESLGEHWRYAGMLTGDELRIVDQKLDRYMAEKARRGAMSHLLIDRFRFDSFAEVEGGEQGARLLTRFGSEVYMFFVITPPDATVERAWTRGLEFGRFKAVDDLLHHNVEAFCGMPDLFFTWATRRDKRVHYEFLDNSVSLGERPRTVAFGWNDEMTVLDVKCLLDVDRYQRIHIDATCPDAVYPDAGQMAAANNTGFLRRCAKTIKTMRFADQDSGRVYARLEAGRLVWIDRPAFEVAIADDDTRAGMDALVPADLRARTETADRAAFLERAQTRTLGRWGPAAER